LTFLGLVGLEDLPRADVPDAIAACNAAGIRVIMITGDHSVTAHSIARLVGLGGEAPHIVEGHKLVSVDGKVSAEALQAEIFARVSPAEKLALVRSYQAAGEIVAVTGEGVNDAPALRQADIGVAMGLRGTDVAREAAAMILLDDAFPTIVEAIRNGRVIFGNIRRFATYLLCGSALRARVPFVYSTGNTDQSLRDGYSDRPVLKTPFKYEELAATPRSDRYWSRHLTKQCLALFPNIASN